MVSQLNGNFCLLNSLLKLKAKKHQLNNLCNIQLFCLLSPQSCNKAWWLISMQKQLLWHVQCIPFIMGKHVHSVGIDFWNTTFWSLRTPGANYSYSLKDHGCIYTYWQTWESEGPFRGIQYIPRNMHTVFALLCFVVVIHWLIFPYPSGLLHWHCGNLTIAPVPAKQPWWIWIMWIHYERLHNHYKAKHNKTVCIFLGIYCTNMMMS